MSKFHFKGFDNLDQDENADFLIKSMEVMCSLEAVQSIKSRAIVAMDIQAGDYVLEVGCGHGYDAEAIGKIVGYEGTVLAIDSSARMVKEAQIRSKQPHVNYSIMSARDMKFNNNTFSSCHVDRLLVGHKDYLILFNEILRVVKPNGIVCITDVDALSIIIYPFDDTTRKILIHIHKIFVNPIMGRMLPELFIKFNLRNIKILPELLMINDFDILEKIFNFSDIINYLVDNQELTTTEAQNWCEEMRQASREGKFLYSVTLFTVIGQKCI